jgi:hypothetical protein
LAGGPSPRPRSDNASTAASAELDVDLLDKGFTLFEALKKKVLSEIKIADLTIGDLAKLGASSSEPESNTGSVQSFAAAPLVNHHSLKPEQPTASAFS